MPGSIPTILFGAFDRHNFGDLLFPHIAAALLPDKNLQFAGLAERDLRACGGHRIRALSRLAAEWHDRPVNIVHVGGELLTCNAWEAAVMLLPQEQAQAAIARLVAHPQQRQAWAHGQLGIAAAAPYTLSRNLFPHARNVVYDAVGGVDLDACEPALRVEVLENLRAADAVGVRDRQTQSLLQAAGIQTRLMPDPAVLAAELFGTTIRRRTQLGEVAQMLQAFPEGYIAVQFSAEFGDDETLTHVAAQLQRVARATGLGIVFFRAGTAPWHDDLRCYERAAARLHGVPARVFTSLDLWDICALIAGSRGYCGSSLHGRIVAMAFALPRVNLRHASQGMGRTKQEAFADAWEVDGMPVSVGVQDIAGGIEQALCADHERLRQRARHLAAHYLAAFDVICAGLA